MIAKGYTLIFVFLLALSLLVLMTSLASAQPQVEEIDKLTEQWLSIERQTQKLENEWRETEPVLRQRLQLLTDERAQLQTIINENQSTSTDVEAQREMLLSQQSKLETQQNELEHTLAGVITQVDNLYALLPDLLRQTWDKEQAAQTPDSNTSNALQVVLAKLSALQQFNSKLSVNQAVIPTPDGKEVLVKQFYAGSGYAWFTSPDGLYQGTGSSLEGEWQWQFSEFESQDDILRAIAMFEKKREPDFVLLPLILSEGAN